MDRGKAGDMREDLGLSSKLERNGDTERKRPQCDALG